MENKVEIYNPQEIAQIAQDLLADYLETITQEGIVLAMSDIFEVIQALKAALVKEGYYTENTIEQIVSEFRHQLSIHIEGLER